MRHPSDWHEIDPIAGPGQATAAGLDLRLRLPAWHDAPADAAERIARLEVTLVGAGSVGLGVADGLARLGVRGLRVVDRGRSKAESLLTHPIWPHEIGRPKASLAASRAKSLSPRTRVVACDDPVEALPRDAFAGSSLVVLASDNLACEVAVAQRCTQLGLPLLQASVYGRMLVGQLRWLENRDAERDACLCCGLSEREWADLDRGTLFSCEGPSDAAAAPEPSRRPTASTPHLCALTAQLALGEILRRSLGLSAEAGSGALIDYCGYTQRMVTTPLQRNPGCPCEHARWSLVASTIPLAALTPRGLLLLAGHGASDLAGLSLSVESHRFAELEACACPTHPRLSRFLPDGARRLRCPACGCERVPHPLHSHEEVPGLALAGVLDRSLAELGAGEVRSVLVRGERGATLLHRELGAPAGAATGLGSTPELGARRAGGLR